MCSLDVLQIVVVFIEHALSAIEVPDIVSGRGPRQVDNHLDMCTGELVLRGSNRDAFQTCQFTFGFLAYQFR